MGLSGEDRAYIDIVIRTEKGSIISLNYIRNTYNELYRLY
jgi:hypothetical protein